MEAGDIPGAVRLFESAVQREPDNQLVSPIANSAPIHNNKDRSSFLIGHLCNFSSCACEMFVFLMCLRLGSTWEHAKQRTSKSLQPSVPSAGQ